jgi:hypothetical protein
MKSKEERNEYCRNYYPKHKEEKLGRDLVKKYGLTKAGYDEMLTRQGGKCAICGGDNMMNGRMAHMSVDHDHTTGEVRGLLCNNCNAALGYAHDNPEILLKLVDYLRRPRHLESLFPKPPRHLVWKGAEDKPEA